NQSRNIVCYRHGLIIPAVPDVSFSSISGGKNYFCGIISGNYSILCWDTVSSNTTFQRRRLYYNGTVLYENLSVGDSHVCATVVNLGTVSCWRINKAFVLPSGFDRFSSITSGFGFSCGILKGNDSGSVRCFGNVGNANGSIAEKIENEFMNVSMASLVAVSVVYIRTLSICALVLGTFVRRNLVGLKWSPPSRASTIRRQSSRIMRRQRSGTSSTRQPDKSEEFTLAELVSATNSFSPENKIGAGSYGVVYKGKLTDGREVAIKRGETSTITRVFQEKESAFESELAFLSRLHHKHLVRLVGFCDEKDERLLVYEFMKNGALYDHLHDKNNVEKSSSLLNSWKMRIKIALDASRGIEYLHNYAVPSIIHRDIKSSNILIDANWTARVSDFGLSLMSPDSDQDYIPTKAAGTVGYIDPEYYGLNVLTSKSDVYGLGVVLLELLTGKRAIFKKDENGGTPVSIVDFAVPIIMEGELSKILDQRVEPPEMNEKEAVELVAYTAIHCVHLEGKDRPTMADIVANLERAFTLCDSSSHGSISSDTVSVGSD
ncbi:hypothetical protein RYX36_006186, partial [Vicia faba]